MKVFPHLSSWGKIVHHRLTRGQPHPSLACWVCDWQGWVRGWRGAGTRRPRNNKRLVGRQRRWGRGRERGKQTKEDDQSLNVTLISSLGPEGPRLSLQLPLTSGWTHTHTHTHHTTHTHTPRLHLLLQPPLFPQEQPLIFPHPLPYLDSGESFLCPYS